MIVGGNTNQASHGLEGAALANYLAEFIDDQWVWMICYRPAFRLRREPAFARTVSVGAPQCWSSPAEDTNEEG
jgi:hypothetical protein